MPTNIAFNPNFNIKTDQSGSLLVNDYTGARVTAQGNAPSSARQLDMKAKAKIAGAGGITNLKFPADTPKYYFQISVASMQGYSAVGGVAVNGGPIVRTGPATGITLPLPLELIDRQDEEYTDYPFGSLYGAIGNQIAPAVASDLHQQFNNGQGSQADLTGLGTTFQNGINAATQSDAVNNELTAAGLGVGQIAAEGPVQMGAAFAGVAINEFFTVLFKGPTYKRYAFSWDLAPRDANESTDIRNIINMLRKAAAPDLTFGNLLWTFPYIATCQFFPQGNGQDTYMYRFKPAVMRSISVNYTPSGQGVGFYRGSTGAPESVRLEIEFEEIEYWLNRDYNAPI